MAERYFSKAISDLNLNKKVIETILKSTKSSLEHMILQIKENLLNNNTKRSRKSSENNEKRDDVINQI